MHKLLTLFVAACLFAASPAIVAEAGQAGSVHSDGIYTPHRIKQLTGTAWTNSPQDVKMAVIFGIELAITCDYAGKAIEQNIGRQPELQEQLLSPFEKAWVSSFKDKRIHDIVDAVDAWYSAHPDQLKRPVMSVLWKEIMGQPVPGKPGKK